MGESSGLVEVRDGQLELLGQIRDRLDDLGEGALDVAGERLELGRGLEHVRHGLDLRHQVGLLAHVVADADPANALDQDAKGAVGHLHHPGDGPGDADAVEVVGPGRVVLGVPRSDHREHPVAGEDVVDEVNRALLADRERRQGVGIGDRLPQRENRQCVGSGSVRPAASSTSGISTTSSWGVSTSAIVSALPAGRVRYSAGRSIGTRRAVRGKRVGSATLRIPSS